MRQPLFDVPLQQKTDYFGKFVLCVLFFSRTGMLIEKGGGKMAGQIGDYIGKEISGSLAKDLTLLRKIFLRDSILRIREFHAGGGVDRNCAALYFDGMVGAEMINGSVVRPLVNAHIVFEGVRTDDEDVADTVMKRVLYAMRYRLRVTSVRCYAV